MNKKGEGISPSADRNGDSSYGDRYERDRSLDRPSDVLVLAEIDSLVSTCEQRAITFSRAVPYLIDITRNASNSQAFSRRSGIWSFDCIRYGKKLYVQCGRGLGVGKSDVLSVKKCRGEPRAFHRRCT